MASFMTLSMELRAMIIEDVLNAPRPSRENRVQFRAIHRRRQLDRRRIYEERPGSRGFSNSLPLLLTSRQVAAETTAVLRRMRERIVYTLDVSVLKDEYLLPTWIHVPVLCNRISTLYVGVRFFERIPAEWVTRDYERRTVSDFHCDICTLLERFLIYGPVDSQGQRSRRDRDVTVRTVVFDFPSTKRNLPLPPANITYEDFETRHQTFLLLYGNIVAVEDEDFGTLQYKVPPKWYFQYFDCHFRKAFQAMDGRTVLERVGFIRILVDGEFQGKIDVAKEFRREEESSEDIDGDGDNQVEA